MKTLIKKISFAFASISLLVQNTMASGSALFEKGTAPTVASQQDLPTSITLIINYFLGLLGLIAIAFLIYAGVLMVTSGGSDDQVGKARKIITYAVVGIIIIILSATIVQFVSGVLG